MPFLRIFALALVLSAFGLTSSAHAIVGGQDAAPGEYPYVAHVTIDKAFGCTGTIVAPTWVVTAGHCSSITGVAAATPIGQPGQLIDVRYDSVKAHEGQGRAASVKRVVVNPDYIFLNGSGYDVALLELTAPVAVSTPVKVAGAGEEALWKPGTLATIAGFGVTESGGDSPDVLQEAQVPIVDDATSADAYDSFENRTQIGAGFPQGGVDTCQGDSGGPLMVPVSGGFRLVGDTSYGNGCAEPGYPGIYGRVADTTLREWIRSVAPEAIAGSTTTTSTTTTKSKRRKQTASSSGGSGSAAGLR